MIAPHYRFTPEQLALYDLARTTWKRRSNAKRRRLSFGEESITETILMDLAETFPGKLSVLPSTKPQEGRYGADWAWLFRDETGTINVPILVQAKLLDITDHSYPEITRFVGNTRFGRDAIRQIDQLIMTAEKLQWPALYIFYNHLNDPLRIPHNCTSLSMSALSQSVPDCWGISFANAYAVRSVLDDKTFDTHKVHSRPLHCLLCSEGLGVRPQGGSPELVLRSLFQLFASKHPEEVRIASEKAFAPRSFSEPPELFQRALAILRREGRCSAGNDKDITSKKLETSRSGCPSGQRRAKVERLIWQPASIR